MDKNKKMPPFYASVILIDTLGQVLLGKRIEDGVWTPPGGSAEDGETPEKTATRETFEECGIAIDTRFLQKLPSIETRNGKLCHCFLYVSAVGHTATSKLDPDQEVRTWKWFSMDEIPNALRDDPRRFESVRNAYMKFKGITKSLNKKLGSHGEDCNCILFDLSDDHCTCMIEKGGKPASIGEVRTFSGKQYQKMASGDWKLYVHKEEKQLEAEKNKKVLSLTQKLKDKVAEKKEISEGDKHLNDLKNQAIVEGQQTRSGKPMFSRVEDALAHGYQPEDFREVGSFFYDRAQKMADNIAKLNETKQKIDPSFEKIKKLNLQYAKSFLSQANHIDSRQSKTASAVKKSVVMMGHLDGAEIDTSKFAMENMACSNQGEWLDRFQTLMDGYSYGDIPRMVALSQGNLYLAKVDEGMYSGVFKRITEGEYESSPESMVDNAKVRIERMTLPSLVQFCIAKEWINPPTKSPEVAHESPVVDQLVSKLEAPIKVESDLDKRIRLMELVSKLMG